MGGFLEHLTTFDSGRHFIRINPAFLLHFQYLSKSWRAEKSATFVNWTSRGPRTTATPVQRQFDVQAANENFLCALQWPHGRAPSLHIYAYI